MKDEKLYKTESEASLEGFYDNRCKEGGFVLKRFTGGYKYFPLVEKGTYLVRSEKLAEIGEYVATYRRLKTGIGLCVQEIQKKQGTVVPLSRNWRGYK